MGRAKMNEPEYKGDVTPRPDPTTLTTEALDRGLAGLEKLLNVRIDALDRALANVKAERDMFPNRIDEKITATDRVHAERFHAISERFDEARNAADKSEAMTTKIIDQQSVLISNTTTGLKGQIDDLKERLTLIEGTGVGRHGAVSDSRAAGHLAIAIIGTIIGAVGILAALLR